ncbi:MULTISPECIES: LytR/AlgR family response regulator transcription factor [Niastella]|uniref:LytTR family transcriptional regulator n=1 Tax=Niastella soli TaxID=2821487 RepID=A0ABS3Z3R1_9BACT|nr:LytTR family DNA-binding domain-containing protein [Niastella soli]MBO9204774.1 LytTR family transcriptional regulator [Niastella soli]
MMIPFFVWKSKQLLPVNPEDVLFLRAMGNYTEVVLRNYKLFMVRSTLLNALKKLPPELFIKTHRGWAVSILHIVNVEKDTVKVGKTAIPISRKLYKTVLGQLNVIE